MGSKRSCPSFDRPPLRKPVRTFSCLTCSDAHTTNGGLTPPADRRQRLSPHTFVTAVTDVTFGLERKVGSELLQKAWCLELHAYGWPWVRCWLVSQSYERWNGRGFRFLVKKNKQISKQTNHVTVPKVHYPSILWPRSWSRLPLRCTIPEV